MDDIGVKVQGILLESYICEKKKIWKVFFQLIWIGLSVNIDQKRLGDIGGGESDF